MPIDYSEYRVSMHRHYYRIAVREKEVYDELDTQLKRAAPDTSLRDPFEAAEILGEHYKLQELNYEQRERAAVVGITFAALCLEAFFYDYAATGLGDAYAKEHLDKLDIPSKLLIIPRLVAGTSIEKASNVYAQVKRLTKDRNFLVHFKSKSFPMREVFKVNNYHDALNTRLRDALANGVTTVPVVLRSIDSLSGQNTSYFQTVCS